MKKIICKKEYDTETATLIKAYAFGELGDPAGYEEDLYQTPEGLYFLHVGGLGIIFLLADDLLHEINLLSVQLHVKFIIHVFVRKSSVK